MRLEGLRELCIRAHKGTSFSPEKRGAAYVAEYSALLEDDLAALRASGSSDETLTWYEQKFVALFTAWMHRKASCISSMIAGPSKFPTRRAEKANAGEHRAFEAFNGWRLRFFKRQNAKHTPKGPDAELEAARRNLAEREAAHKKMKAVNNAVRKPNAEQLLTEMGFSPAQVHEFLNPAYSYEKKGFQAYRLTNNNAEIRRLTNRVELLEAKVSAREKAKATQTDEGWAFDGGSVQINRDADRVQVRHNQKPDDATRTALKKNGFNWSPSEMAWQRKLTENALYATRRLFPKLAEYTNQTALLEERLLNE